MHQTHPCFATPPDDTVIRRYIDLAKLVSMLDTSALWFAAPSTFEDAWEGCYPKPHYDPTAVRDAFSDAGIPDEHLAFLVDVELRVRDGDHSYRDMYGVNCWHAGRGESDALWKLYASGHGVALVSSVGRLRTAMSTTPETVYIGAVSYLDHERDQLPTNNAFWRLLWKRQCFEHENEVRAVLSMGTDVFETIREDLFGLPAKNRVDPLPRGRNVKVHLDRLLASISVSPLAPPWFADAVRSVVVRYGLGVQIDCSQLAAGPPRRTLHPAKKGTP